MAKPKCKYLMPPFFLVVEDRLMFEAKDCITDTAGFHFVITTPAQTLDKHDRRAIKGHATRAGVADRHTSQLRSWISPGRELGAHNAAKAPSLNSSMSVPSPRRFGGDFSGLQLPSGVEPHMIQDLVKCIYTPLLILSFLLLLWNKSYLFTESDQ